MINPAEINRSITNRYLFDISRHYKIWFSVDPDTCLGLENELNLIRFRHNNPEFPLSLIYSVDCLSPSAIGTLEQFCLDHQIALIQFEDLEACLQEPSDKELFAIAQAEIAHAKHFSDQGGNMASAADTTRLMRYVIETYGNYSEFDGEIHLSQLNTKYVELKGPVLFPTEIIDLGTHYQVMSNSDFLAFSLDKSMRRLSAEAWQGLKHCQLEIIEHYKGNFVFEKFSHGQVPDDFSEKYPELREVLAAFYTTNPSPRTVFDFRKYLSTLLASTLDAQRSERFASYFMRLSVVAMSGPTNTLLFFKHLFPAGQAHIPIFISKKDLKRWQPFISAFMASGIGFYNPIYTAIKSNNSVQASLQAALTAEPTLLCHQAWTKTGRCAKLAREQTLYNHAEMVLGFWQRHSVGKENVIHKHLFTHIKRIGTAETILTAVAERSYSLALRKACFGLQLPVVKLLLQTSGISLEINELTSKNQTALDLARSAKGNQEDKAQIVALIRTAGGKTAQELESCTHSI